MTTRQRRTAPSRHPDCAESRWAAVSAALGTLAAARCARLKTKLARHEGGEVEALARLAYEASFDDSAEGERLHRYQARWGRSLLRTLAVLEELRGHGSPADEEAISHGCTPMDTDKREERERSDPREEAVGRQDLVGNFTSEVISSDAGAGVAGGEQGAVMVMAPATPQEEKAQIKPIAAMRSLVKNVKKEPCANQPIGSKAALGHSCCRGSDQAGHGPRTLKCASDGPDVTRAEQAPQKRSEDQARYKDRTRNLASCRPVALGPCREMRGPSTDDLCPTGILEESLSSKLR